MTARSKEGAGDSDAPRQTNALPRRSFLGGAAAGSLVGGGAAGGFALWKAHGAQGAAPPQGATMNPRLYTFVGGDVGPWSVLASKAIVGEPLPAVRRLEILQGTGPASPPAGTWRLRGVTSNERYATRAEKTELGKKQAALGRPESKYAALIPIRKSAAWWALTQDERRAIFEERSRHVTIGLKYLPGVARRLHHCRDLGESEPFDFVTLFDYTQADAAAFDDMLGELRASEEWKFVEREFDIRLVRDGV